MPDAHIPNEDISFRSCYDAIYTPQTFNSNNKRLLTVEKYIMIEFEGFRKGLMKVLILD